MPRRKHAIASVYANLEAIREAESRFWLRVDKTPGHGPHGDCWMWTGNPEIDYGRLSILDYPVLAHRLSYFYAHGILPGDKVCHTCDIGKCVNPSHLVDASQAFNVADMWTKGRGSLPPVSFGENHPKSHLSDVDAIHIRELMQGGARQRDVAAQYGISSSTAWRIGHGITRNHAKGHP